MAITTTLLNVSTTRDAVSVPQLAQGSLVRQDTVTNSLGKRGEEVVSTYILSTSSIHPLTVTVRRQTDIVKKTVHYSLKISTYLRSVDADGIVVDDESFEAGTWFLKPISAYEATDAQIEALLGNVYALWFASVDGVDVPTTTLLNKLRLELTNIY